MTREQKTIKRRAKEAAHAIRSTKGMKKKEREATATKIITIAEKDIQKIEVQRTGNGIPNDAQCIICERKIKTGDYQILGFRNGEMVYRHEACVPGSSRWMKSRIGQESDYRKYFKEEVNHNE